MDKKTKASLGIALLLIASLGLVATAAGQNSQPTKTLVVPGRTGEATVIQARGRNYVDVEALAQMLNGSVAYKGDQLVLTLPGSESTDSHEPQAPDNRFSREFVNASIETLGSMREWATILALTIKKGYQVGESIEEYRGRAMKNFALANAAVSNDADRQGMQLLSSEFNNLKTWSDQLVNARKTMSAANYTMSEDALRNDPLSQKILQCWKFLGPMIANGKFEDDGSCR